MAARKRSGNAQLVKKRTVRGNAFTLSTEAVILQAAERLFARDGYDGVSTKQLAAEAGLTIGALYHYFSSKDAVYAAATRHAFATKAVLPKAIRESTEPAERKLARLAAWFVGIIVADKSVGRLLQRELLDPHTDAAEVLRSDLFGEAFGLFQDLLRELLPNVDLDDALASLLALLFGFSNLKGIRVLAPKMRNVLRTPEEIGAHATSLLLRGLRG